MNKNSNQKNRMSELGRKFSDTTILLHEQIAAKVGLSGADHKYLGLIMQHGPMTAGRLAEITGLTTGSVTGLIDRMEKRKLVKRNYDKTDRRKVTIVPEHENIMTLLGPVFTDLQKEMEKIIAQCTDKERVIIERYLTTSIDAMTQFIDRLKSPNR